MSSMTRTVLTKAAIVGFFALSALDSSSAQGVPVEDVTFGGGVYGHMTMLLEKSIFKVDVLTLDVYIDDEAAGRLESIIGGREYANDIADSIAHTVLAAHEALAHITFLRNVSIDQFLDAIDKDMKRAVDSEILAEADYRRIMDSLPAAFMFLDSLQIQKGDEIWYRIRGDTLRTVYRRADGTVELDQIDVGPARPRSVLGTYFAKKSSFRKGLIQSLF